MIFGASYDRTGTVKLATAPDQPSTPPSTTPSTTYAFKDRDHESLLINDTIEDNITLPSMRDMGTVLSDKKLHDFAQNTPDMSTKMVGVNQYVSALSGGNKQKVVLARGSASSPTSWCSLPTRGIDIKVKGCHLRPHAGHAQAG